MRDDCCADCDISEAGHARNGGPTDRGAVQPVRRGRRQVSQQRGLLHLLCRLPQLHLAHAGHTQM